MVELIQHARQRLQEVLATAFAAERTRFEEHLPSPGELPDLANELRRRRARRSSPRGPHRHDVHGQPVPSVPARRAAALRRPAVALPRRGARCGRCRRSLGLDSSHAGRPRRRCPSRRLPGRRLRPRPRRRHGRRQVEPAQRARRRRRQPGVGLRPTTSEPIAWIPRTERAALEPLLDWLDVGEVREHESTGLGPVAILDLPDMDSSPAEHRARVEALLPLSTRSRGSPTREVRRRGPPRRVPAIVAAATRPPGRAREQGRSAQGGRCAPGPAGPRGRLRVGADPRVGGRGAPLERRLAEADRRASRVARAGAEAKRVVRGRIAASSPPPGIASAAGAGSGRRASRFSMTRDAAVRSATDAVLRASICPPSSARRSPRRGPRRGPAARAARRLTSLSIERPGARRPSPIRTDSCCAGANAAAWGRPSSRSARRSRRRSATRRPRSGRRSRRRSTPARSGRARAGARSAIGGVGTLQPPTSRWWTVFGVLQTLATAAIALSAAWVVLWILARPVTGSIELPVLGPVPSPSWRSSSRCSPAT